MIKKVLQYSALVLLLVIWVSEPVSAQRRKKKNKEKKEEIEINPYDIDYVLEPIPINRQFFHDRIDKLQTSADMADGEADGRIVDSDDSVFTRLLTESMIKDLNHMQIMVENFSADTIGVSAAEMHQIKLGYLRALFDMAQSFNADYQKDGYYYKRLTNNMREVLIAEYEGELSEFVYNNMNLYTLNNTKELLDTGSAERRALYVAVAKQEPEWMIKHLADYAFHPYSCDVLSEVAKVLPNYIFNYATSTSQIRYAIERCQDPLVRTIVKIARQSRSPLRAMPFLNDIYKGKKTIAEIDNITANEDLFYQNLVRLKLENVDLGGDTYTDELQYRGLRYVREMNDLHEEKGSVRFRCINGMPPEVLYFILVYGQDEIYTSSFLGTFERMLERMAPMRGDQLLEKVHRDKFRTFIRMCAGYNTLDEFLATMDTTRKMNLMKDFVAGLEKGKEDDLEGAVDVADAFGSIRDTALADFLLREVMNNYEQSYKSRSKKGVIIYGLLTTLFKGTRQANDSKSVADQSERLKLPPINLVPYEKLTNDKGIVYEQFFFYGDEDGRASFNSFLTNYRDNTKWQIVKGPYWTKITSVSGKPTVVYANMPLEEPEDEAAIDTLCKFLVAEKIEPTVLVHRGHSYHLPLTLERLSKKNKIVILGSCGGYHNLSTVLTKAPDANIISSKQTGAMSVNEPILKSINDQISAGKDINWITTWEQLDGYFSQRRGPQKEMFDDYVPPHRNLGAIFIKAYRRLFNADI